MYRNNIKTQRKKHFDARHFLFFVVLYAVCSMQYALCADIQFEATVDSNTVSLGSSLQLNLSFYGAHNMPAPKIGSIDGFRVRYVGPSTRISIVNGEISASVTHVYRLLPLKTGTFKIGPFSVNYKGKTLTSNSITVNVISSGASSSFSTQKNYKQPFNVKELSDRIFITVEPAKTKAYLNESIPLTIKLYVNHLAVRDIQYPQIKHDGFSMANFGKPKQYRETLGGVLYDVIEFDTRMFAVKPGKLTIGPAVIKCNLVMRKQPSHRWPSSFDDLFGGFDKGIFDDFFGSYELYPFNAVSPKLVINVLPLPEEGKPSGFKGAVGDFRMDVKASPREVNVGDPITLTMAVEGDGNFDTVMCPELSTKNGFKVYQPHEKSSKGTKVFEQILMPESKEIKDIPEVVFSFFNPRDGQYHTIKKGPFSITVKASKGAAAAAKVFEMPTVKEHGKKESLGKDIVYIKEEPGRFKRKGVYIYQTVSYWSVQLAILLIFSGWLYVYKYNQRLKNDVGYARRLAAPRKARAGIKFAQKMLEENNAAKFFDAVFGTLREYLADRLHLPLGSITQGTVDKVLESKGVNEDMRNKIRNIFDDCDIARFAPSEFDREKMDNIFESMRDVIDYMEKKKV